MILEKFKLNGKIAVITGGAGLLGYKHAQAIIEAGGSVALLDINEHKLHDTVQKLQKNYASIIGIKADITNKEQVRCALEEIKNTLGNTPCILINNAAIDPKFNSDDQISSKRFENFPKESWDLEIAVGLTGSMICSQVFGSEMAKNEHGVIINIASDLGIIAPDQRLYRDEKCPENQQPVKPVTYSVIKHGLIGLTRYIATYWADKGVRCNALAPGGVYADHSEEFVKRLTNLIPLGRMANLDEYMSAIVFLCSDASSYMNGAVLVMDGGRSVW